ncbi:MAG: TIGR02757 family protein [Myxococcaceae bacterium]
MSAAGAARLKPLLDGFVESRASTDRVQADPVEFPHRYRDPRDVETVALLSASLAYGRADLFKPKIASILSGLGSSPASAMAELTVKRAAKLLDGFVYRFNLPADVAVLLMGIGAQLRRHGSLEAAFVHGRTGTWKAALATFAREIREAAPEREIVRALGKTRGLSHLLPSAEAGAAKRLNLYLRWMVRRDAIDFGVWKQVSPAELMIPLDTHVMRISRWLGLTRRATLGWNTAEEVTASLRLLDAADPVRYDFALCHYGMSGACPARPVKDNCRRCPLRSTCRIGRTA